MGSRRRSAAAALAAALCSFGPARAETGVPAKDRAALEADLAAQEALQKTVENELREDMGKTPYSGQRAVMEKYRPRREELDARRDADTKALLSLRNAPNPETYVEFSFSDVAQATMTRRGGTFFVSLPKGVEKAIKAAFPGYRLPETRDFTGQWASNFDAYLYLHDHELAHRLPFCAALSDFDGDGTRDVALVLFRDVPRSFKVAAFHRHGAAYSGHLVLEEAGGPQSSALTAEPGLISFTQFEADSSNYIWEKGKYVPGEGL